MSSVLPASAAKETFTDRVLGPAGTSPSSLAAPLAGPFNPQKPESVSTAPRGFATGLAIPGLSLGTPRIGSEPWLMQPVPAIAREALEEAERFFATLLEWSGERINAFRTILLPADAFSSANSGGSHQALLYAPQPLERLLDKDLGNKLTAFRDAQSVSSLASAIDTWSAGAMSENLARLVSVEKLSVEQPAGAAAVRQDVIVPGQAQPVSGEIHSQKTSALRNVIRTPPRPVSYERRSHSKKRSDKQSAGGFLAKLGQAVKHFLSRLVLGPA